MDLDLLSVVIGEDWTNLTTSARASWAQAVATFGAVVVALGVPLVEAIRARKADRRRLTQRLTSAMLTFRYSMDFSIQLVNAVQEHALTGPTLTPAYVKRHFALLQSQLEMCKQVVPDLTENKSALYSALALCRACENCIVDLEIFLEPAEPGELAYLRQDHQAQVSASIAINFEVISRKMISELNRLTVFRDELMRDQASWKERFDTLSLTKIRTRRRDHRKE